jgi:hypothetical protein
VERLYGKPTTAIFGTEPSSGTFSRDMERFTPGRKGLSLNDIKYFGRTLGLKVRGDKS